MPATDTIDFEREFHELGEPVQPWTLWDRVRGFAWRRSLLVLAPACVLGVVAAAVIHGVANSGPRREAVATVRGTAGAEGAVDSGSRRLGKTPPVFGAAVDPTFTSPLPVPTPGRYQDYEAWMRVRVNDLDALSERTNDAM